MRMPAPRMSMEGRAKGKKGKKRMKKEKMNIMKILKKKQYIKVII